MACFGTQEVVGRTRMSPATKSTAPCLAKAHGAESQKPVCKEPNSMDAITRRHPAAMPPMNTAARVALVALVAAAPAGVCAGR